MDEEKLTLGTYVNYLYNKALIKYNLYHARRTLLKEFRQVFSRDAEERAGDLKRTCPELGTGRIERLSELEREAGLILDKILG